MIKRLLIAMLFSYAISAQAVTTYVVDPASNTAGCHVLFQTALDQVVSGDTIYVKAGGNPGGGVRFGCPATNWFVRGDPGATLYGDVSLGGYYFLYPAVGLPFVWDSVNIVSNSVYPTFYDFGQLVIRNSRFLPGGVHDISQLHVTLTTSSFDEDYYVVVENCFAAAIGADASAFSFQLFGAEAFTERWSVCVLSCTAQSHAGFALYAADDSYDIGPLQLWVANSLLYGSAGNIVAIVVPDVLHYSVENCIGNAVDPSPPGGGGNVWLGDDTNNLCVWSQTPFDGRIGPQSHAWRGGTNFWINPFVPALVDYVPTNLFHRDIDGLPRPVQNGWSAGCHQGRSPARPRGD